MEPRDSEHISFVPASDAGQLPQGRSNYKKTNKRLFFLDKARLPKEKPQIGDRDHIVGTLRQ